MVSEGVGRCSPLDNTVSSFFSPLPPLSSFLFLSPLLLLFAKIIAKERRGEETTRCSCYAKRDRIAGGEEDALSPRMLGHNGES